MNYCLLNLAIFSVWYMQNYYYYIFVYFCVMLWIVI